MSSFGVAGGSELEMGPEKAKSHFQDVVRERGGSGMILIAPINIPLVMINYNGAVKRFFPSFFPRPANSERGRFPYFLFSMRMWMETKKKVGKRREMKHFIAASRKWAF